MSFAEEYLAESAEVLRRLDTSEIEKLAQLLAAARGRAGRLFILGVGGSAANASHAVNDFRKICGMEAYCPTDNVSELTARTNDEGWASVFEAWLRVSRLRAEDCLLVFSVGGGNLEKQVSPNLVSALQYAKSIATDKVQAVYVDFEEEATAQLKEKWQRWGAGVELVVLASPYRELTRPLLKHINRLARENGDDIITVVVPEFIPAKWWQHILHNQSSLLLKGSLLFKRGVIVTSVPYHLEH